MTELAPQQSEPLVTSAEIAEIVAAKARARAQITNPAKNRVNPFFSSRERKAGYADLPAVLDSVMPAWTAEGLDLTQTVSMDWPRLTLTTLLAHASGQWMRTNLHIEISDEKGRSRPQSIAAATTLLRRVVLSALAGVSAEEDDDGNEAPPPPPSSASVSPQIEAVVSEIQLALTAGLESGALDEQRVEATRRVIVGMARDGKLSALRSLLTRVRSQTTHPDARHLAPPPAEPPPEPPPPPAEPPPEPPPEPPAPPAEPPPEPPPEPPAPPAEPPPEPPAPPAEPPPEPPAEPPRRIEGAWVKWPVAPGKTAYAVRLAEPDLPLGTLVSVSTRGGMTSPVRIGQCLGATSTGKHWVYEVPKRKRKNAKEPDR